MVKVVEINIAGLDPNNMNNSQSRVIEVESWRTYTNYYRDYKGKAVGDYCGINLDDEDENKVYSGYVLPRLCKIEQLFCDDKQLCCIIEHYNHMCTYRIAQLLNDKLE